MFSEFTSIFLEISEIFLTICFVFFGIYLIEKKKETKVNKKIGNLLIIFLIFILSSEIAVIFAKDKQLAFLSIFKWIEFFGIIAFIYLSNIKTVNIIKVLFLVALYQGFVGLMQFYNGASLGLSFIGEQPMSIYNAGSPKISFEDTSFLRATGTFLHPNILSCFLVVVFFLTKQLDKKWRIIRWILIIPIFLTFSRIGLLAFFIGILFSNKKILNLSIFLVITVFLFGALFLIFPEIKNLIISRVNIDISIVERWQFVKNSLLLLFKHPFGIGGGNYLLFISSISPFFYPWEFQPVHNIFLLSANEFGIISGISLLAIFSYLFLKYTKFRPLLLIIFIFGIFDHFLITIHSGVVIFALIVALILKSDKVVILDKLKSIFGKS